MTDIKTALANAINEWATEDKPAVQPQAKAPTQTPHVGTHNVTRTTFEYVRDRPGVSYKAALVALQARGFKASSITSLFSQMRRAGMLVRDADDRYTAVGTEYTPMKAANKSKPVKHLPAKSEAGTPPALVPIPPATVITNDIEYILNTMPIKQARELYDALHKIFGGAREQPL